MSETLEALKDTEDIEVVELLSGDGFTGRGDAARSGKGIGDGARL